MLRLSASREPNAAKGSGIAEYENSGLVSSQKEERRQKMWVDGAMEEPITIEHVQNNQDVRDLLLKRGIRPEALPPEEDLVKLERRVKSQEKMMAGRAGKISPQLRSTGKEPEDQ
jgi:hypothetical protein